MEAYLETFNLLEVVEEDYEVLLLLDNPTRPRSKVTKKKKRKAKAKACLFAGVSQTIFTRVMTFRSATKFGDERYGA